MDDMDLEMITSPNRIAHRRSRSDPSDFLRSLRADRFSHDEDVPGQMDLEVLPTAEDASALKRQPSDSSRSNSSTGSDAEEEPHSDTDASKPRSTLFDNLPFEGPSTSMFTPEELAQPKLPNYSKKDVPMWTVEEDLLILQLVEQHGKKWSKIAAHLPGRTDNGVRNRWNRMERAQVIKQMRPAGAGYRCRRCGEPKRGHICAARTIKGEAMPEGDELHVKAAALTDLSAKAMTSIPVALPAQQSQPMASRDGGSASTAEAQVRPASPLLLSAPAQPAHLADTCLPTSHAASAAAFVAPIAAAALTGATHTTLPPADLLRLPASEVDAFLEELRRSLDDAAMGGPSPLPPRVGGASSQPNSTELPPLPVLSTAPAMTGVAPPALVSQHSLQQALSTLSEQSVDGVCGVEGVWPSFDAGLPFVQPAF